MAIASALRRAPRAAAHLAALASRPGVRIRPPHHRAASVSPFSSIHAPQPSAADAQLLRVLNFEISCAQSECRKPNWVMARLFYKAKILGEDFPFEIKDKEGTNRITLTRTCKKEQIEVEVHLPSPADGAAQDGEQEDQAEEGEKQSHAGSGVQIQYYIPLVVRIRKGAASCLEISCSSYPEELVIESLDFGSSDESGGGSLSGGIAFSNLPEELQKALHPYLGIRGISEHFTDFLHAYMINKECHEYLSWLRRLKGLVKN